MALGRFDGGDAAVPGGVDGPVSRVVVVGAGIAGLTTAHALERAGVECVVLEARSRLGGRLHSAEVAGCRVDLGGSWLHHPTGNPLRRFADLAGIGRRPGNPLTSVTAYDLGEGRWLTDDEVGADVAGDHGFAAALPGLRRRLGPRASAAEGIRSFLDGARLSGPEERRAWQALRADVEADAAGAAEDQSLEWLWTQDAYDEEYFGDLPDGGYGSVVAAMAAGLDVRLDSPVAGVEVTDTGVTVSLASGETVTGSHVVVAVPLGVLQRRQIAFTPPLPPERTELVDRLGFGRYEKVVLAFGTPFWREAGWSHLVLFPPDPDQPSAWVVDLDAFGIGPLLACHVFHSATPYVATDWPAGAARWVTDRLGAVLGHECPEPVDAVVTDWGDDPWAGGSYTHVPPDCTNADLDRLGTPVGGRILLAGEHTQSARVGYADGAMASGVREAKRLLGTPTVTLGVGD